MTLYLAPPLLTVPAPVLAGSASAVASGTGSPAVLAQVTLPGKLVRPGRALRVQVGGRRTSANASTVRLSLAGTVLVTRTPGANAAWWFDVVLGNPDNAQARFAGMVAEAATAPVAVEGSAACDWTKDQPLVVDCTQIAAGDETLSIFFVQLL